MVIRIFPVLALCALALYACGTQQAQQSSSAAQFQLPAIGELDQLWEAKHGGAGMADNRQASDHWWGHNIAQFFGFNWGSEPIAASPSATVVGDTLELDVLPSARPEFAVYAIPVMEEPRIIATSLITDNGAAVVGQNGASLISNKGGGVIGQNGGNVVGQNGASLVRGYALANYETNRWSFADSLDNGLIDVEDLPGDAADYHSPAGNIYVAPLLYSDTAPVKVVISSVTGLPCDAQDNSPAPDVTSFTAAPVDGGIKLSWGDLGADAGNVMVKVFISTHSFVSPDEEAVLPLVFPATDREVIIPWNAPAFVRAATHHVKSCKDGTLSAELNQTPLAGDLPNMTIAVNKGEIEPGSNAIVTATGCDSYDWDLDGDGTYEFTDETTGQRFIFGAGEPGVINGRVRGHVGTGEVIRSFSVIRHNWVSVEADPEVGGGRYLQLKLLPDGRPVIAHTMDTVNELQYCLASDAFGNSWAAAQKLDINIADLRDMQFEIANGKPVIVVGRDASRAYDCYSPTTDDGSSGWQKDVSFVGGDGVNARTSQSFSLLGNSDPLGSNGEVLVAYESYDGTVFTSAIHVVRGTPDGAGGFNWSGGEIALADPDGVGGNGWMNPQSTYVAGSPVVFAQEFLSDPSNVGQGGYGCFDGTDWVGGDIPELFNVSYRQLFDSNGRIAVLYYIGFDVHYVYPDQPGAVGGLDFTDIVVGQTDWFLPVLTRNGIPEYLGLSFPNYTITRADDVLPVDPADWTTRTYSLTPSNPWENGDWLYLPSGNIAIAHIKNGTVYLSVYY